MRTCLALVLIATAAPMAVCLADTPVPGLLQSTVLNGVKFSAERGELYLNQIQAVNLPKPEGAESFRAYDPDSGGKLWAILANVADEEQTTQVVRYDFWGELRDDGLCLLSSFRMTDLATEEPITSKWLKLEPGDYVLDFFIDAGRFYSYGFTVRALAETFAIALGTA